MEITIQYLTALANTCKKWDRGVLRKEVCESLNVFFKHVHEDKKGMENFLTNQGNNP